MKSFLKKTGKWLDDRGGFSQLLKPLTTHFVPPGTKWNYVWGSATLFCFILQLLTGIALAFLYQPSVATAYDSLQYIENGAFLGSFIRGLHNWGASGMVVLIGVHMARVYLNAAYKYPREMSWITGVLLLGITITLAFTGQLMRWDGNGVWTGILAAEQMGRIPFIGDYVAYFFMGGTTLGGETLNRFFALHVFVLPGILVLIIGFHLYLVFRNGISEPPKPGRLVNPATYRKWYDKLLKKKGIPFFPDVIWRDVMASMIVLLILLVLAVAVGAPKLTEAPDPTFVKVEPHPDWYFEWIYAIFATMNRHLEPYFLFFAPVLGGMLLFAIPFLSKGGERSPLRRPWAVAGVISIVATLVSLTYVGLKAPWVPKFKAEPVVYTAIPKDEHIQKGVDLFNDMRCLYCHKMNGKGGESGPDLTDVQQTMSRDQIIIRIINGTDDMPGFGSTLKKEELNSLVDFLMVEQKKEILKNH